LTIDYKTVILENGIIGKNIKLSNNEELFNINFSMNFLKKIKFIQDKF